MGADHGADAPAAAARLRQAADDAEPPDRRAQRRDLWRLARPLGGRDGRAEGRGSDLMSEFGLPRAESPEQVGLSSARLERLAGVIRADVARRLIPGAVLAIARGGRLAYGEAFGWRDREAGAPLGAGAVFWGALVNQPIPPVPGMVPGGGGGAAI